jgi:GTPase SAR1 family protein
MNSIIENKKIVLVGPPEAGKTTIKKVFFEMANPYELLKASIKPTRGVNSSIYSLFDLKLGVFDLAGQENLDWFKGERKVFSNMDILICVIDINMYLKELLVFLNNVINFYKEIYLNKSSIVILAHKIDLIDKLYLQHKIKALKDFFNAKKRLNAEIYPTSIEKEFFLTTYEIISGIIAKLVSHKSFLVNKTKLHSFRNDIKIIMQYDIQKQYDIDDLFYDLNLPKKNATFHLERLVHLGFVEFMENRRKFQLTDKARFFRSGLVQEKVTNKDKKINKILENLYYFSNINKKMN